MRRLLAILGLFGGAWSRRPRRRQSHRFRQP